MAENNNNKKILPSGPRQSFSPEAWIWRVEIVMSFRGVAHLLCRRESFVIPMFQVVTLKVTAVISGTGGSRMCLWLRLRFRYRRLILEKHTQTVSQFKTRLKLDFSCFGSTTITKNDFYLLNKNKTERKNSLSVKQSDVSKGMTSSSGLSLNF